MQKIRTYSTDEKLVAERREQIVRSAVRIVVRKGYGGTGIREIAEACDMTIGNLYHYIGRKEDIIYLAQDFGLSLNYAFVEQTRGDLEKYGPREVLERAIDRYIRHINNTSEFTNLVYKELRSFKSASRKAVLESEMAIMNAFEDILDKGCREGCFKVSDIRMAASGIVTMAEMWAVKHWQFKGSYTLDEYIRTNTELVFKQVGAV